MTAGSMRLGTYAGIPVRAHWSMALIAALLGVQLSTRYGLAPGLIATVAFFASILAHEFGHALVARRYGVQTQSIDLWALGGVAHLDRESPTARADGLIAVAGPAVSLTIGVVAFGLATVLESSALAWIGIVNGLLAVFNMLPGAPLDGGRVLRAIRWARTGNKYRAMREAGNAGRLLGWLMVGGGVLLMLNGQFGVFFILTGAFIAMNAKAEIMASYIGEQLDGTTVGDLTWFGIAEAGTDMDADSMIWQRQRLGNAGAVAVLDDNGHLDGLVMEEQLWAVPSERRAMVMLTQLMVPFNKLAKASPDEELSAVLPRLNPLRPVVTVWNGDKLLGIVPPKRLEERLKLAQRTAFPARA
ncbi:MAG TPA: site-2 protease family protein [Ilumatobacteraceae bacterium]|nr:site-2 protease family protein [Ilumatobacteraceae bacterium]